MTPTDEPSHAPEINTARRKPHRAALLEDFDRHAFPVVLALCIDPLAALTYSEEFGGPAGYAGWLVGPPGYAGWLAFFVCVCAAFSPSLLHIRLSRRAFYCIALATIVTCNCARATFHPRPKGDLHYMSELLFGRYSSIESNIRMNLRQPRHELQLLGLAIVRTIAVCASTRQIAYHHRRWLCAALILGVVIDSEAVAADSLNPAFLRYEYANEHSIPGILLSLSNMGLRLTCAACILFISGRKPSCALIMLYIIALTMTNLSGTFRANVLWIAEIAGGGGIAEMAIWTAQDVAYRLALVSLLFTMASWVAELAAHARLRHDR